MSLQDGRDILIAREQAQWVQHLERAYCDEAVWRALSNNGLEAMRSSHTLAAGTAVLREILGLGSEAPVAAAKAKETVSAT